MNFNAPIKRFVYPRHLYVMALTNAMTTATKPKIATVTQMDTNIIIKYIFLILVLYIIYLSITTH